RRRGPPGGASRTSRGEGASRRAHARRQAVAWQRRRRSTRSPQSRQIFSFIRACRGMRASRASRSNAVNMSRLLAPFSGCISQLRTNNAEPAETAEPEFLSASSAFSALYVVDTRTPQAPFAAGSLPYRFAPIVALTNPSSINIEDIPITGMMLTRIIQADLFLSCHSFTCATSDIQILAAAAMTTNRTYGIARTQRSGSGTIMIVAGSRTANVNPSQNPSSDVRPLHEKSNFGSDSSLSESDLTASSVSSLSLLYRIPYMKYVASPTASHTANRFQAVDGRPYMMKAQP